jgi:hypothetical protein
MIYAHAFCGGISLLSGLLAVVFKKGSPNHKKSGKVFYISLFISAVLAIIVSLLPSNFNPFLLAIGVFSLYLLLSGYRALRYQKLPPSLYVDQSISGVMLISSILMIVLPLVNNQELNIVLTVFGSIGFLSAIRDFCLYQNPQHLKKNWLRLHLGNMLGAFIASLTAFLVVNQFFPPLVGWLGPTVLGSIYIAYWNRKLKKSRRKNAA